MSKKNIWNGIAAGLKKRSPEILLITGIGGMITTVVLAVRATPKAMLLIDEAAKERAEAASEDDEVQVLTPADKIKAAWKAYIPAALTGIGSAACLVFAHSANARRNAALAAAYTLSESALKEYQAKVIETIGEKKEREIRDAVDQDRLKANPVSSREVYITRAGDTLCYDHWSGRYFKTDVEKLRRAANEVSRRMLDEMYISLNDFYEELGLPAIRIGEELGWNVNREGLVELRLGAQLAEGDIPCIVLDYLKPPVYDFMR